MRLVGQGQPLDPERLRIAAALLGAALLTALYLLVPSEPENRWAQLFLAIAPNAIVVLVGVPILYALLLRPSSTSVQARGAVVADMVAEKVKSEAARLPEVADFKETWRDVQWADYLDSSEHTIDLVAYYLDSWTRNHAERLETYFRHRNAILRLVLPDPARPENMVMLRRLFPEYSEPELRNKVAWTIERLREALNSAGGPASRLEVYLLRHPLLYSAQCFDGRYLVLSVFEAARKKKIASPAVVIDLGRSQNVARFWAKELAYLKANADRPPDPDEQVATLGGSDSVAASSGANDLNSTRADEGGR